MTIKLVATDMDGTFLDGNGRFDMDRLKSLLVSYKKKGIYFAVASGRGFLSLEKLFADVRDDIIFIAENGSLVEYQGQFRRKKRHLGFPLSEKAFSMI